MSVWPHPFSYLEIWGGEGGVLHSTDIHRVEQERQGHALQAGFQDSKENASFAEINASRILIQQMTSNLM